MSHKTLDALAKERETWNHICNHFLGSSASSLPLPESLYYEKVGESLVFRSNTGASIALVTPTSFFLHENGVPMSTLFSIIHYAKRELGLNI